MQITDMTPAQQAAFEALTPTQFAAIIAQAPTNIAQANANAFFASFDPTNVPALTQLLTNAFNGYVAALSLTAPTDLVKAANTIKQHYSQAIRSQALYTPPKASATVKAPAAATPAATVAPTVAS